MRRSALVVALWAAFAQTYANNVQQVSTGECSPNANSANINKYFNYLPKITETHLYSIICSFIW